MQDITEDYALSDELLAVSSSEHCPAFGLLQPAAVGLPAGFMAPVAPAEQTPATTFETLFDAIPPERLLWLTQQMQWYAPALPVINPTAPIQPPVDMDSGIGGGAIRHAHRSRSSTPTSTVSLGVRLCFPEALYNVVSDPFNSCGAMWNQNGTAFRYRDEHQLLVELQAQGIKARKDASISKNLNDFRFQRHSDGRRRKQDDDAEDCWTVFSHSVFRRGNIDGVREMRRKGKRAPSSSDIVLLAGGDDVW